jgi:hypothetical protein
VQFAHRSAQPESRVNGSFTLQRHKKGAGHVSKLSRKQQEAIMALLAQRNVEEAARVAGRQPGNALPVPD